MYLQQDEREGWGEISPLHGFSLESLEDAQAALLAWADAWREGENPALPDVPSAAFGISCALAELDGSLPEAGNYRAAPLCTGDPDELFAQLSAMPGEKVAKIKVGLYEAVRDGMVANLLLEAIPDLHLRLDANRARTPLKGAAVCKVRQSGVPQPHCLPRRAVQNPRGFARVCRETGIAIARDESLREADFEFAAEPGVSAVVIKPTLTGSGESARAGRGGARLRADGGHQLVD